MKFDQFLKMLDKNNRYFNDIGFSFKDDCERGTLIIERKGRDLPEVIERYGAEKLFPVVDKKLGLVFICKEHGLSRQELFRYHYYSGGADRPDVDSYESIDRYISEGHGWFISKMRPRIIVAGMRYRPDQFDRDVFISHQVEHQDLTRDEKLAIIRGERRIIQ